MPGESPTGTGSTLHHHTMLRAACGSSLFPTCTQRRSSWGVDKVKKRPEVAALQILKTFKYYKVARDIKED